MPVISEQQLYKVQSFVANQKAKAARVAEKSKEKAGEVKGTLECVGAAFALGYVRGKREDAAGVWNAPFIKMDFELVIGSLLAGTALFDMAGKYDEDVLNMGNGILSHYAGQVARKMGKTGKLTMVAGAPRSRVGALPQYDNTSFNPTQYSAPYDDPVAAALAQSGL